MNPSLAWLFAPHSQVTRTCPLPRKPRRAWTMPALGQVRVRVRMAPRLVQLLQVTDQVRAMTRFRLAWQALLMVCSFGVSGRPTKKQRKKGKKARPDPLAKAKAKQEILRQEKQAKQHEREQKERQVRR